MSSELISTFLQSSGAAGVSVFFIWYLNKFNKDLERERARHDNIVQEYLKESIKVKTMLAEKLQQLADSNKEQRIVLEAMYKELLRKSRIIKTYEDTPRRKGTTVGV